MRIRPRSTTGFCIYWTTATGATRWMLDKERVIENNENYKVIDLESVAHGGVGDVVDLSEEQNVDRYTQ